MFENMSTAELVKALENLTTQVGHLTQVIAGAKKPTKSHSKKLNEVRNEFVGMVGENKTMKELAAHFNVSIGTIARWKNETGLVGYTDRKISFNEEEFKEKAKTMTVKGLAEEFGMSSITAAKYKQKFNISTPARNNPLVLEKFKNKVESHTTLELVDLFGVSAPTVTRWAKELGLSPKCGRNKLDFTVEDLRSYVNRGFSAEDAAQNFGVSVTTIRNMGRKATPKISFFKSPERETINYVKMDIMLCRGHSVDNISRTLGCSKSAVYSRRLALNL